VVALDDSVPENHEEVKATFAYWYPVAKSASLSPMQAFEATLPPLKEDADGVFRVAGTRVSLDSVVGAFDMGATAEEIVQRYPSLGIASVYEVIAYVLRHRSAVDDYLLTRQRRTAEVRAEVETLFPPNGIRARLLERQAAASRGMPR
jgi:uncharacterized protein (DUF433 family)